MASTDNKSRVNDSVRLVSESERVGDSDFRLLVESSPNLALISDSEGRLLYCNEGWMEYVGTRVCEKKQWLAALHPDDRERYVRLRDHCLSTGKPLESEIRLLRKDGTYNWFLSRFLFARREGVVRWMGTLTNIEEQKQVQETYREQAAEATSQRKWVESILEAVPLPVSLVDPASGRVTVTNRAGQLEHGRLRPETVEEANKLFRFRDSKGEPIPIEDLPHSRIRRGETVRNMEMILRIGESDRNLLFNGARLPSMYGHPETSVISSQDITHLKQTELELREKTESLEAFASIASHDLREPLRTISNFVKLLTRRYQAKLGEDADVEKYVHYILEASERGKDLIEDLLEFARAGKETKAPRVVELDKALAAALGNLHAAISEKNAIVEYDALPAVLGHQSALTQLFQNLIANGLKYNESKPPRVQITSELQGEHWLLRFRDNGIGIAQQHQASIFVPFKRLHGRADYSGTGLGLAVCRKIVQAHHGRIWVESAPGEGSTFCFTLPQQS